MIGRRLREAGVRAVRFILEYPKVVVVLALLLTALGASASAKLRLQSDIAALLPDSFVSVQTAQRADREVGGFETMWLVLEGAPFEQLTAYADQLVPVLEADEMVLTVDYKRDVEFFEEHALLYIDSAELTDIRDGLEERIQEEKLAANPLFIDLDDDEESTDEASSKSARLQELEEKYAATDERRYYTNPDKSVLVLMVYPDGANRNVAFARRFRERLEQIVADTPPPGGASIEVTCSGNFQNKLDEYSVIIDDVKSTAFISITAVFVLIAFYFRRLPAAIFIALALAFGICWTFGVTYYAVGQLNIMTVFLFVVLFGLGIDYGIHLLARYAEERGRGESARAGLEIALLRSGGALAATAATTALAFYSLMLADFRGFSEFGFIAGTGVVMSFLAVVTVLPAMVLLAERVGIKVTSRRVPKKQQRPARRRRRLPLATPALAFGLGVAVLGSYALTNLELEYDFSELRARAPGVEERKAKTADVFNESNSPAIVLTESREQLALVEETISAKIDSDTTPTIRSFRSLYTMLPDDQAEKLPVIASIRELLADQALDFAPEDDEYERMERLRRMAAVTAPITVEDLPVALRRMFQGKQGSTVQFGYIVPSVELKDGRNAIAFADDVGTIRTADGSEFHASNSSIIFADLMRVIVSEGPVVVGLTLLAVCLVVFLTVRRVRGTALMLAPLAIGIFWLFVYMGAFDVKLNFYNMVVLPSIIGIGIDSGVHIYHRYRSEGPGSVMLTLRTTGGAVAISSMTTMVGFGGMMFAHHPGLRAIGTLAVVGIALTMLAALTMLPAALHTIETGTRPSDSSDPP